MKKEKISGRFNKKIFFSLVFIFFILLFDRSLFFLISKWEQNFYKKKNFKQKFIKFPPDTYDILIMGSSRARLGIHPFYIYKFSGLKAKNIARNACSAKFNYYFYQNYKKHAQLPKLVIYGVDYFIFKMRSSKAMMQYFADITADSRFKKKGFLYLVDNKAAIDSFLNNVMDSFNNRFKRQSDKKFSVKRALGNFFGLQGEVKKENTIPNNSKSFGYGKYPGVEGGYFASLLEELDRDGVKVFLVVIPEYIGTYIANYQWDLLRHDLKKLGKPYKNVCFLDYNRPESFPLANPKFFRDGGYGRTNSHLSIKGGKVFNEMLVKDLKKILRDNKI